MQTNLCSSSIMHRIRLGICVLLLLLPIVVLAASVSAAGSLDPTFLVRSGPNDWVMALALQPDGKIVIGGYFTTVNGVPRNGVARLNADGTLDTSFDPGSGVDDGVLALVVQPDGKIIIGGYFTSVNGTPRNYIARLNADGSLDTTFDVGSGPNDWVMALALQPDGKTLVGGLFQTMHSTSRSHIARLNADGSLDTTFDSGIGTDDWVMALALQPDGKILAGGYFTTVNGVQRNHLARLQANGSLDTTFAPASGPNDGVLALAVQPDGKLVIGGAFTTVDAISQGRIARLNTDGSLDGTFNLGTGVNDWVKTIALQPSGQMIIGGYFTTVNGVQRNHLAGLRANGSLDTSFASTGGTDATVWTSTVQPNSQILIGGAFSSVNGADRSYIARLQGMTDDPSPSPPPTGPRVFLSPATRMIAPEQTFQLDLRIDPGTLVADTVDAYITFDPAALEVVDAAGSPATTITANTQVVNNVTYNRVSPDSGRIDFSASRYASPHLTEAASVATIRFKAKATFGTTHIRFLRQGILQSDLFRGGSSLYATLGDAAIQINELAAASDTRSHIETTRTARFAIHPTLQAIQVGEIIPLDLWTDLSMTTATSIDFILKVDPRLVDLVDAAGHPVTRLELRRVVGAEVTANMVVGSTGEMRLSIARLRVPATASMLRLATLYVRAKQPFTTTPITLQATGRSQGVGTAPGQSIQAVVTGNVLTMADIHRIYLPQTGQ